MSRLPEEQFPPWDAAPPEANDPIPARWVVDLRVWICSLLTLLRIHSLDCEHCNARATCWIETRKRIEELNWYTQQRALRNEDHRKIPDSKSPEL